MYLSFGLNSLFITKQNATTTALEIAYNDLTIREAKAALSDHMLKFNALIGLKRIRQYALLMVASEISQITTIGLSPINEIKRIGWVAVAPEDQQASILQELKDVLDDIQQIFVEGLHYYSTHYDLSLPYVYNKLRAPDIHSREYYDQFVWNLNLSRMDGSTNRPQTHLFQKYCNRIIQGYLEEYISLLPNSEKIRYILVSRRSTKKAGTRFYARGIDDYGNVANFTETQQIVEMNQLVFTHLQIRGSVPAFFAQTGVNGLAGELVIQRPASLTLGPFCKHFQMLTHMYKRIFAVNLLSDRKSEEKVLSNFYEELVHSGSDQMPFLKYQFYDFHQECKGNKFENSQNLIDKLADIVEAFGFTCYDVTAQKFLREQSGVFRTNCLDCLDRTNYVQSRLALRVLKLFLLEFGDRQTQDLVNNKLLLDLPVNQEYPLLEGFNYLWADNGDSISILYTGIPSTHTDITRTGQRTLIGSVNHKFRSLMRFYTQFTDHKKQNGINTLVTPTSPRRSNPTQHDFHTTFTISFQTNSQQSQILENVDSSLRRQRPTLLVYFVYANQQSSWLDKLKCYFQNDGLELKAWRSSITSFSEEKNYMMIGDLENQFCWLGVFCMREATHRISEIKKENLSSSISSGEALLIKMKLESSSFIFAGVNCTALQDYLKVFDEIHEKGFQTSKLGLFKSASLFDLEYRVILGNTGSKLKISEEELLILKNDLYSAKQGKDQSKASKIINQIMDRDEMNLQQLRYRSKYIREYSEGPIDFIPSANRLLFWNEEGVILRVRDYGVVGVSGFRAVLDYQIGRSLKHH